MKIHVTLELDSNVEPISGVLQLPTSSPQPFTGWLELTQMLEAIRTSSSQPHVPQHPPASRG